MAAKDFARTWEQLDNSEKSWFADCVGEYLEKNFDVTSSAGRLGRIDGIDSRAVVEAIDFSCRRMVEEK